LLADAQVHGLDFYQSYAPVADFTVVRVILSIAARQNRVVHSLNASNALVRAPLAEVVYVRPPKILADRFGSKIIKLKKALHGLAPLSCHLHLEKDVRYRQNHQSPNTVSVVMRCYDKSG
jgi:hypothetical protein